MSGAALAMDVERQLGDGVAALGLELPAQSRAMLIQFIALLEKWNRTYNLTAIRQADQIVSIHLLDSLAIARFIGTGSVLDVGSGGGFPGVPLAIARPDLKLTLLDSNQKKTAFLRQAIASLKLTNVEVVCERVEQWDAPIPFDWIVSRAFADLGEFVRSTAHLLTSHGVFAAMKGVIDEQELSHLPPHFKLRETVRLAVPGLNAERHLVLVECA